MTIMRSIMRPVMREITRAVTAGLGGGSTLAFSAPLTSSLTPSPASFTNTFVRATLATIPDDSGTLVTCAAGEPQFEGSTRNGENDWTATASSLGVRIERAATNLALQSDDLSTTWTSEYLTSIDNAAAVSPDGQTNANKFKESTADNFHYIWQSIDSGASGAKTFSVYAKKEDKDYIWMYAGTVGTAVAYFNVSNGTVGTVSGTASPTAIIEDVGDSWYRCSMTLTMDGVTGWGMGCAEADDTPQYAGTQDEGNLLWRAQLEPGGYPTTSIETAGAAATRDKTEAEYAITLNTNDITIACDWTPQHDSGATDYILTSYSDADNFVALMYDGSDVIFRKRIAASNNDAVKTTNVVAGTTYRLVGRLDSSAGVDVWVDTVKGTTDATATAAVVGTALELGALTGGSQTTQNVKLVDYYESAKTDDECAAL